MTIQVRYSRDLMEHLSSFEHDGTTVAASLFEGDRLSYPGRKVLEHELGYVEPYTLELEARVIEGLGRRAQAAIRFLSRETLNRRWFPDMDPTLELLWMSHGAWHGGVSVDRLVAALVMVNYAHNNRTFDEDIEEAANVLIVEMHRIGFPPGERAFEELFDGAPPACVGLGLVDL